MTKDFFRSFICVALTCGIICGLSFSNVAQAVPHSALSQAVYKTKKDLSDRDIFPLVNDSYIKVDETHKLIIMSLVVNAATNRATALDLGDKMIRLFSANAVDAGSGTTMPSGRNYGSLFDEYTISLGIAPSHAIEDQSRWFYSGTIRPGTHRM